MKFYTSSLILSCISLCVCVVVFVCICVQLSVYICVLISVCPVKDLIDLI